MHDESNVESKMGDFFFNLSNGIFLAQFTQRWDKARVLCNGSSFFDKNIVLMQDYDGNCQSSKICLDHASFWIRLYDLSLNYMNGSIVRHIGNSLWEVEDIDIPEKSLVWGEFLRICVKLDIHKPLPRIKRLCLGNSDAVWVRLKYEKLPNLCYYCGLFELVDRDCTLQVTHRIQFEEEGFPFGPWLRVEGGAMKNRGRQYNREPVHDENLVGYKGDQSGLIFHIMVWLGMLMAIILLFMVSNLQRNNYRQLSQTIAHRI